MLFALANCCKGVKIQINLLFCKTPFIYRHSLICNVSNKTRLHNGKCGYLFTYIKSMKFTTRRPMRYKYNKNIFEIEPLFGYRNIHV